MLLLIAVLIASIGNAGWMIASVTALVVTAIDSAIIAAVMFDRRAGA